MIGTNAAGNAALPNGTSPYSDPVAGIIGGGIVIEKGASGNQIGTDGLSGDSGEGNVISGNDNDGIDIVYSGTNDNIVAGNLIGTDPTGNDRIGEHGATGSSSRTAPLGTRSVGPSRAREMYFRANINGVEIYASVVRATIVVEGNDIGTDVTGTVALGNL